MFSTSSFASLFSSCSATSAKIKQNFGTAALRGTFLITLLVSSTQGTFLVFEVRCPPFLRRHCESGHVSLFLQPRWPSSSQTEHIVGIWPCAAWYFTKNNNSTGKGNTDIGRDKGAGDLPSSASQVGHSKCTSTSYVYCFTIKIGERPARKRATWTLLTSTCWTQKSPVDT